MKLKYQYKKTASAKEILLYTALSECRPDRKGYGIAKAASGEKGYYDLVNTDDTWATHLRVKKGSTTYAIGDNNIVSSLAKASSYVSDSSTATSIPSNYIKYSKETRGKSHSYAFAGLPKVTSINVTGINTSLSHSFYGMFMDDAKLASITGLNTLNTSKIDTFRAMFYGCESITNLNVSGFNTSLVTDMAQMFHECHLLTSLNLTSWDVSSVEDTNYMFNECNSLKSIDLSTWRTPKLRNCSSMFFQCENLEIIDISNFETGSGIEVYAHFMFDRCPALKYIIIGSSTFKFKLTDRYSNIDFYYDAPNCKILVPSRLISTYQNAAGWSEIQNPFDAIENYNITRSNGKVTVTHK